MRCPRCGGYLTQHLHFEEGLEAGSFRDWYARCWGCGLWLWRPRLVEIIAVADLAADHWRACSVAGCDGTYSTKDGKNPHSFCPQCWKAYQEWASGRAYRKGPPLIELAGEWRFNPEAGLRGRTAARPTKVAPFGRTPCVPCAVQVCHDTYLAHNGGGNPLGFCRRHYDRWSNWQRGKIRIKPIIQIDGTWQDNPEWRTKPLQAKPRQRPCRVCGRVRSIQRDGMCGRCQGLADRGTIGRTVKKSRKPSPDQRRAFLGRE